jgi:hypothetical protein
MKQFIIHIILFLLPLGVLILILPVNKRLEYQGLNNDCFDNGIWIHDRIINNEKPIDIAFLGSSHTINGINDSLIETKLNEFDVNVTNLGYCRLGRNLTYLLLRELLNEKKPKTIIIEVREDENWSSHPIFPFISQNQDVLLSNPIYDPDYFSDIATHFTYNIQLTQETLYKQTQSKPIQLNDFGFSTNDDSLSNFTLVSNSLIKTKRESEIEIKIRDFRLKFPKSYLKKIHQICNKKHVKVLFLYLPNFGSPQIKPNEYQYYLKFGEVLIPPVYILNKQHNWYDEGHLNITGSTKLSLWIAEELKSKYY